MYRDKDLAIGACALHDVPFARDKAHQTPAEFRFVRYDEQFHVRCKGPRPLSFRTMRSLMLAFILLPCIGHAWGPTGHRVVGLIAEQHLSHKARKAVKAILGSETLSLASTWMDEVRSDHAYDHTRDWHWVTIPDGSTYAAVEKNPNGDLVEAIDRMRAVLRSDTASVAGKRTALRFLVHLIGDLHQPLHVGRGDDKGGNDVQVRWMKQGSNLHRVWDSGLIDLQDLSYTELAASLDPVSQAQRALWQSGSVAQWAEENLAYRARIYPVEAGAELGYAYSYANWPLVREQLLKGGVRLAGMLNAIYR